jgi:hypothetical protein
MIRLLLGVIAMLLSSCATEPAKLTTASGRPEVAIQADPEKVKSALLNKAASNGYTIVRDTAHQIAFDVPSNDIVINVLFASRMSSQAHIRVTFTILPRDSGTHVLASVAVITNPGTAFEQVTPIEDKQSVEALQSLLLRLSKAVQVS